jgi:hypothetical protein
MRFLNKWVPTVLRPLGSNSGSNSNNQQYFDATETVAYHGQNPVHMEKRDPGELKSLNIKLVEQDISIKSENLLYKNHGLGYVYGFDFEIIQNDNRTAVLEITNIYKFADEYDSSDPSTHRRHTPAFDLWNNGKITKGDHITLDLQLDLDLPTRHMYEPANTQHPYNIINNALRMKKSIKAKITPKGLYRYGADKEKEIKKNRNDNNRLKKIMQSLPPRDLKADAFATVMRKRKERQKAAENSEYVALGSYINKPNKKKKSKKFSKRNSSRKKNKKKLTSNK